MTHQVQIKSKLLFLAITANNGDGVQQNPGMVAPQQQQGMVWVGEGAPPPQGNPPMAMMGVNGQMVQPQMEFYGNQPMMVQDPNFYPPQNWPGPNMRPLMNGPPQRPMFNQGWMARPQWREERPARGHPPRNGGRNGGYLESAAAASILMIFQIKSCLCGNLKMLLVGRSLAVS